MSTPRARLRDRRGMTLVELLAAILIAALVLSAAMSFFQQQGQALSAGTSQMNVTQNHRYAVSTLRRDLRTAGSGMSDPTQPPLLYAGEDVVAFNADYLALDANDLHAVYVDTAATPGAVRALSVRERLTIPRTTFSYPDTTYRQEGRSGAETIIFYFAPDSTTARGDDYVLFRQVNHERPGVVARNLVRTAGRPFFEYLRLVKPENAASRLDVIPAASLPLRHAAKLHGSKVDTGRLAWVDSIRAVRVNLTATNGLTGERENRRSTTRLISLPNMGQEVFQTCGERPTAVGGLNAVGEVGAVELRWDASADETGGERDVMMYVVWRKQSAADPWGDPVANIPAGVATYTFTDEKVTPGVAYHYGVAAQDCTPNLATIVPYGPVVATNP